MLKRFKPYFLFGSFLLGEMLDYLIIHATEPILLEDQLIKVGVFDLLGEIVTAFA